MRVEDCLATLRVDAEDGPAAAVNVAEEIALILVRRGHFDLHDRLEENSAGLLDGVLQREDAGHLERQFVGIDFVERSIDDLHLDVDHLVAGMNAAADGFFDAVDDRRDVFLGNGTANDLVFDLDALALFVGLDLDAGMAVLTATTRLADELAFTFSGLGDGFAVGDLGSADVGFDFELALEAVDDDFQVEFTHSRDDELTRLFVGEAAESGIFFRQTLEPFGHLVAILLGLRLDRHADDRLGERRRFERHVVIFVAERVARGDVTQADQRGNVTSEDFADVFALAALNDHQAADALALAGARVVNVVALLELSGIDAEEDKLARVWICPELEGE